MLWRCTCLSSSILAAMVFTSAMKCVEKLEYTDRKKYSSIDHADNAARVLKLYCIPQLKMRSFLGANLVQKKDVAIMLVDANSLTDHSTIVQD